jgi:hypothetical protein
MQKYNSRGWGGGGGLNPVTARRIGIIIRMKVPLKIQRPISCKVEMIKFVMFGTPSNF